MIVVLDKIKRGIMVEQVQRVFNRPNPATKSPDATLQMRSFSICCCRSVICDLSWEPSLARTAQAMTGRETPHARPSAPLERTKMYGTFLSSHSSGKWSRISSGAASAAKMTNSAIPRFNAFVAE